MKSRGKYYPTLCHATTRVVEGLINRQLENEPRSACTLFNASTEFVKGTSRLSSGLLTKDSVMRHLGANSIRAHTGKKAFLNIVRQISIAAWCAYRRIRAAWHAGCITPLPNRAVAERWLFCEPLSDAHTPYPFVNLSKLSPMYGDQARHG